MTDSNQQACGVLELHPRGYGFLRHPEQNYRAQRTDPFVTAALIQRYMLRPGALVEGQVEPPRRGEGPKLNQISTIEGLSVADYQDRKGFDSLTAIDPHQWIRLEVGPQPLTVRVMDLLTPIGRGQRGLIVAPPRTGKTVLLQHLAASVAANHPDLHLMMLLIDERPEEVTDFRRTVQGEVAASSSDRPTEEHIRLAMLMIDRAKRMVEAGGHVFVLIDSLTRLARAFNKHTATSGRIMSGGLDVRALDIPKRLFGSARACEEGGSLTVVATCLIDTGSRMDEVIFQEFKGTGNMELVLDRRLADRRVWPAMDIQQSGTRKEERLLPADDLRRITLLRRTLASMHPVQAMELLTAQLAKWPSNQEFLDHIQVQG